MARVWIIDVAKGSKTENNYRKRINIKSAARWLNITFTHLPHNIALALSFSSFSAPLCCVWVAP